jgi:hypothetical protein
VRLEPAESPILGPVEMPMFGVDSDHGDGSSPRPPAE